MDPISLLRHQTDVAFRDLCTSIEGVDEQLAWAVLPLKEGEYLHTMGSILNIVQHTSSCKLSYGSFGFRDGEIRFRDCADRLDLVGSSWSKTVEDLHESHRYWLDSWADLSTDDLEAERPHHSGRYKPIWHLITIMSQHDTYHAGQIEILKVSLRPASTAPESYAEDIRQYCKDDPYW